MGGPLGRRALGRKFIGLTCHAQGGQSPLFCSTGEDERDGERGLGGERERERETGGGDSKKNSWSSTLKLTPIFYFTFNLKFILNQPSLSFPEQSMKLHKILKIWDNFPSVTLFLVYLSQSISINEEQRNCRNNLATMLFLLLIFTLRYHIPKGSARKVSVLGLIILLTRWATMVTWWAQSSAVPYLWFKEKAIFIQLFIQLFRKARRWLP